MRCFKWTTRSGRSSLVDVAILTAHVRCAVASLGSTGAQSSGCSGTQRAVAQRCASKNLVSPYLVQSLKESGVSDPSLSTNCAPR